MFSERVMKQAALVGQVYPGDAGLKDAIDIFTALARQVPEHYEFEFHLNFKPEALGNEPNEVFSNLLMNFKGWAGYFLCSSTYNLRHLIGSYCEGLNSANYFAAVSSTRSIVERLAVLSYHCSNLNKQYSEVKEGSRLGDQQKVIVALVKCVSSVLDYAKLTRLNWDSYNKQDWDIFFNSWDKVDPSLLQKNILTLIEKLPQDQRGARFRYDLLSEFVHPNAGSHLLSISTTSRPRKGTCRYILDFKPTNTESLDIVIHLTSSSVIHSLNLAKECILWLQALHGELNDWEIFTRSFDPTARGNNPIQQHQRTQQ